MSLVETFLFIMILVTLFNGFIFFRMLIKLQKRNNELLKMLLEKERKFQHLVLVLKKEAFVLEYIQQHQKNPTQH